MNFHVACMRLVADLIEDLLRIDVSAEDIVGVFYGDHADAVEMIARGPDERLDLIPVKNAVRRADGASYTPGKLSDATDFIEHDVGALMGDDLVATLGMRANRALIAHCPGGDENGGFLAHDLGRHRFQPVEGWGLRGRRRRRLRLLESPDAWRASGRVTVSLLRSMNSLIPLPR